MVDDDVLAFLGSLPRWQERASCAQADPEAFYPEPGDSTRLAQRICVECEVRAECLDFALSNNEHHGIWGGLTAQSRKKLRRHRAELDGWKVEHFAAALARSESTTR